MNSQVKKINKALKEKPLVIIAYLMEGCGWCEKLKPEWKKVKKNKNYLYESQFYSQKPHQRNKYQRNNN